MFAGYPMFALRAYLRALSCPDENTPLKLNTCQLRRDVAHLALIEVLSRLHGRRERAVASKHQYLITEARPAFHRLKLIEEIAKTRECMAVLLRKGTSPDVVCRSRDGTLLLTQLRSVLATPFEKAAKDVYRALGEIHAFNALVVEVDQFKAGDEKAAEAQMVFWQNSFEVRELSNLMAERIRQIFARAQFYTNELPGLTKLKAL